MVKLPLLSPSSSSMYAKKSLILSERTLDRYSRALTTPSPFVSSVPKTFRKRVSLAAVIVLEVLGLELARASLLLRA